MTTANSIATSVTKSPEPSNNKSMLIVCFKTLQIKISSYLQLQLILLWPKIIEIQQIEESYEQKHNFQYARY